MKSKLIIFALVACLSLGALACNKPNGATKIDDDVYYARFMANCDKSELTVVSGFSAIGGDVLLSMSQIKDAKASRPSENPQREGYDFIGWFTDREATKEFDFSSTLSGGVTLFAGWKRTEQTPQEEYVEPIIITEPEIDGAQAELVRVKRVLGEIVNDNLVTVSDIAIQKLAVAENVADLISVSLKNQDVKFTAEFSSGELTVTSGSFVKKITVKQGDWTVENSTYESKAQKYEIQDVKAHSVILAGSSSMENWTTSEKDAKPLTTLNVGIGGTTVEMWTNSLSHRLIYRHNPRAVVFYVGINNIINAGDNGTQTGEKLVTLMDEVHTHLPNAHIYYVLINYVPGYMKYKAEIDAANSIIKSYSDGKEYMTLIDAGKLLLKPSGKPNTAYFLTDGLHMSLCGYTLWGGEVKSSIIRTEKQLYN